MMECFDEEQNVTNDKPQDTDDNSTKLSGTIIAVIVVLTLLVLGIIILFTIYYFYNKSLITDYHLLYAKLNKQIDKQNTQLTICKQAIEDTFGDIKGDTNDHAKTILENYLINLKKSER
jgi:cell division protein FtsL